MKKELNKRQVMKERGNGGGEKVKVEVLAFVRLREKDGRREEIRGRQSSKGTTNI